MIEEIINEIKETEKEADAMIRTAREEAESIIEEAKKSAERINKDEINAARTRAETDWKEEEERGTKELLKNEREIEVEIRNLKEQALIRVDEAVAAVISELV